MKPTLSARATHRSVLGGSAVVLAIAMGFGPTEGRGQTIESALKQANPVASGAATVVTGSARLTVLTPGLVRAEWSEDGRFEDRASLVFANRRPPLPAFTSKLQNQRLVILSDQLKVRFMDDGKPFSARNLAIDCWVNDDRAAWWPDMEDHWNLGGTALLYGGDCGNKDLGKGLISQKGWVVIDDSATPLVTTEPAAQLTGRPPGTRFDLYFFGHGIKYPAALKDFATVSGFAPLPPRCAFGTWWSVASDAPDAAIQTLGDDTLAAGMATDVIVIRESGEGNGYRWALEHSDALKASVDWSHKRHAILGLQVDPHRGISSDAAPFKNLSSASGLGSSQATRITFDAENRELVDAWFTQLHRPLERQGIDFFESRWAIPKNAPNDALDAVQWANRIFWKDGEARRDRMGKRPMMVSDWAGLGSQRYGITQAGEVCRSWRALAGLPRRMAAAGNSGCGFWINPDCGSRLDSLDAELAVRWIQLAVFSPVFQLNADAAYGSGSLLGTLPPLYRTAALKAIGLREALIPHIYTAAKQQCDENLPVCRALYLNWPNQQGPFILPDEFLFGDDLLVAPVTAPADDAAGAAVKLVWIPPGKWVNWFTDEEYQGPRQALIEVPIDETGLFVRSGAVIATAAGSTRAADAVPKELVLHVFGTESGGGRIYEDDGITTEYMTGKYAITTIEHQSNGAEHRLNILPPSNRFDALPTARQYEIRIHGAHAPAEVMIDGAPVEPLTADRSSGWTFDPGSFTAMVRTGSKLTEDGCTVIVRENAVERYASPATRTRGLSRLLDELSGALAFGTAPASLHALFEQIRSANIDSARKQRLLGKALGARWSVRAQPSFGHKGIIKLDASFCAAHVGEALPEQTVRARLEFDSTESWDMFDVHTTGFRDLHDDQPVDMFWHIGSQNPLRPARVQGRAILTWDDQRFVWPIAITVMPSINSWNVLGPIDEKQGGQVEAAAAAKQSIDLGAVFTGADGQPLHWHAVQRDMQSEVSFTSDFHFRPVASSPTHEMIVYTATYLQAAEETEAVLVMPADYHPVAWLQGDAAAASPQRTNKRSTLVRIPLSLSSGTNELLVRLNQIPSDSCFFGLLEDAQGHALTQVHATLTAK